MDNGRPTFLKEHTMGTQELAQAFTDLCRKGQFDEAGKRFWSDDIVSKEAMPGEMAELKGRKAVEAKGTWWYENHEVHGAKVEGPYVNGDQFVVRFTMDVTPKGGKRMGMDEVGLYTVKNGKIVEESFFFGSQTDK
jgi:ketosteroid isomerase-like protein